MIDGSSQTLSEGWAALKNGDWALAQSAFEKQLVGGESAEALDGLAQAAWWRADTQGAIAAWEGAYVRYQRDKRAAHAALIALRLWEEYEKALALEAAANGWLTRAHDLLAHLEQRSVHGRLLLAQADRAANPEAAADLAKQALQIARGAADPDLELIALGKLGLSQIALGRVDEGAAAFDEAMAAATSGEPRELRTVGDLYCSLFLAMELIQDSSRFEQWTEVVMGFVQRHNHPELLTFCGTCCAELFAAAGQWKEVEKQLLDTLRALEASGQRARCVHPSVRLASLRIAQGRFEEADRLLGRFADLPEATQPAVSLHLARGETALAAARLHRRLNQVGRENLLAVPLLSQLVEVQVAQHDVAGALESATQLRRIGETAASRRVMAAADLAEGHVKVSSGDASAADSFGRAIDSYSQLRMPYPRARAHLGMALALAPNDPGAAIHEAKRALSTFAELGATRDADQAAGILRQLGVGGRTGPRGMRTLTRRELDVLRHLADGLTNAEIAARLYVSTKTIDTHVGNILSKLGVRNRGEAAAWAHRNLES